MLNRTLMMLLRLSHKLWVRVVAISVFALLAAVLAPLLAPLIPQQWTERFDEEAVMPILSILASGMLAVTTFSLNVMVAAYRSASAQATPRAYRILLQDTTTQTVLATFVGAFIFSLAAIILFRAGVYGASAAVIVFLFAVGVVTLIVVAILRWIDHLSRLGSMDHTLDTIETMARAALEARAARPGLGGVPLRDLAQIPPWTTPVPAPRSGYLQFIDMPRLQEAMEGDGATAFVRCPPGSFVLRGRPLAFVAGQAEAHEKLADLFIIADYRSMEQDARFGLTVLSEIASRALSPGVNDPGTALDVTGRVERLLWETGAPETGGAAGHAADGAADDAAEHRGEAPEAPAGDGAAAPGIAAQAGSAPEYPRVRVLEVTARDLLEDGFGPIARDGAATVKVARRLLTALDRLAEHPDPQMAEAAAAMREYALEQARAALELQSDRARLEDAPQSGD